MAWGFEIKNMDGVAKTSVTGKSTLKYWTSVTVELLNANANSGWTYSDSSPLTWTIRGDTLHPRYAYVTGALDEDYDPTKHAYWPNFERFTYWRGGSTSDDYVDFNFLQDIRYFQADVNDSTQEIEFRFRQGFINSIERTGSAWTAPMKIEFDFYKYTTDTV